MTIVTVFQDYAVRGKFPAAPSAFDVSPEKFEAMPAHMRSELCGMLREAGYSIRRILQTCGITAPALSTYLTQRHQFAIPERIQPSRNSGERVTPRDVDEIVESLNLYSCRVLTRMPKSGPTNWKRGQLEAEAHLRNNYGIHCLKELQSKGLVRPIGVAEKGFIQPYVLTTKGAVVADAIDPRDVAHVAEDG